MWGQYLECVVRPMCGARVCSVCVWGLLVMDSRIEKLILLALASENAEEAVAALRKARKLQPTGKLDFMNDRRAAALVHEREKFNAEREAFEEERRTYQRRVMTCEAEMKNRNTWRGLGSYALFAGRSTA